MNYGNIANPGTVENQLYCYLANRPNKWISAMRLVKEIQTIALHTYICGVRQQLPIGWRLENKLVSIKGTRRKHSFYRLVPKQGETEC